MFRLRTSCFIGDGNQPGLLRRFAPRNDGKAASRNDGKYDIVLPCYPYETYRKAEVFFENSKFNKNVSRKKQTAGASLKGCYV